MSGNGNNIFQACSNVQVNGGSFSISGRDTNTQTVHYHTGSASHHFGYAQNVNTGMNNGHFAQGGAPGYPSPPRNNTYPGPYGFPGAPGAPPPPGGGWNHGQRQQSYQQYTTSPPATPGPAPPGTGSQFTPGPSPVPPFPDSRNPFRQNTTPATPPRRPSPVARASSDDMTLDDVDVVDLDDEEVTPSESPAAPKTTRASTAWATSSSYTSYSRRT